MTTKLLILAGFCIAFAAGLMFGLSNPRSGALPLASGPTTSPTTRPLRHRGGFLASELNLSAEQQAQMDKIWSDTVRRGVRGSDEQRRQFRKQRDDAIVALIRPDQQGAYQTIVDNYSKQMESLDTERRAAFDNAVQRTKELLTPEQRSKYESLLKRGPAETGPREHGENHAAPEFDHNRWPGNRATTRPPADH
jgi:Spy/CpxP family protein refolding chaperone